MNFQPDPELPGGGTGFAAALGAAYRKPITMSCRYAPATIACEFLDNSVVLCDNIGRNVRRQGFTVYIEHHLTTTEGTPEPDIVAVMGTLGVVIDVQADGEQSDLECMGIWRRRSADDLLRLETVNRRDLTVIATRVVTTRVCSETNLQPEYHSAIRSLICQFSLILPAFSIKIVNKDLCPSNDVNLENK